MMLEMFDSCRNSATNREERIATGSLVRLQELGEGSEWEVAIVSSELADPETDRISDACPIGEALLGRRAGEVVHVEIPMGAVRYRVISVSRPRHTEFSRGAWQEAVRSHPGWEVP